METQVEAKIKAEVLPSQDPTFEGGSVHTAAALMTNPTVVEFTYSAELYLDVLKVATSGVLSFVIPAGGTISVNFPLVMPLTAGDYEVFLDIWSGGELLAHYRASENVVIEISPGIVVGPITWA